MTPETKRTDRAMGMSGLMLAAGGVFLIGSLLATSLDGPGDCELALDPHVVPARGHPVLVQAVPTRPLPAADDVSFPEESGLVASLANAQPARFLVNPVEARAGDWRLTLRRDGVEVCAGNLIVAPRRLPGLIPQLAQEPSSRQP